MQWDIIVPSLIAGLLALGGSLGGSYLVLRAEANKLTMTILVEKRIEAIWNYIQQSNLTFEEVGKALAASSCKVHNQEEVKERTVNSVLELYQSAFVLVLYLEDEEINIIEAYVQLAGRLSQTPSNYTNNDLAKLKVLKDQADKVLKIYVNPSKLKEAVGKLNS